MSGPVDVTPDLLADHPLPDHRTTSNKRERGTAVVVGGSQEAPGGILLAGLAALRAGTGVLQLATVQEAAVPLAIAIPEALVVGLRADEQGHFDASAAPRVASLAGDARAVLLGTATREPSATEHLLPSLLEAIADTDAVLVLDAGALPAVRDVPVDDLPPSTILMPNPVEMAHLLDIEVDAIERTPEHAVRRAVGRFGCTVALRGPDTWIAGPEDDTYLDSSGSTGLAMSGSGDVLAGLIVGYAARGAAPRDAVLWATHVHGVAGERCAAAVGGVGFLMRELIDAIPATVTALAPR